MSALPPPLERPVDLPEPLAGFVATELAEAIERGAYRPGDRLVEAEIAARFGVSRAPVREALRMLMQDDLVVRRPRRGTIVTDLSADEMSEMFEVRSALYAATVRLFVRRCTPDELGEYAALLERMRALAADPAVSAVRFVDASQAASVFLVARCGNARLQTAFRKMTRQSYRVYAELALGTVAQRQLLVGLVAEMLAAASDGDAERASMLAWRLSEANHAAARAAMAAG